MTNTITNNVTNNMTNNKPDPRIKIWQRSRHQPVESEAPLSGIKPPAGEDELFNGEKPLPRILDHPGMLPPHYRMPIQHPGHTEGLPPQPLKVPRMPRGNILYDTLRSQQLTSHHIVEYLASGTVTPPVNSSLSLLITNITPTPLHLRLVEQPFCLQAYVIVRRFCAVPLASTDTGAVIWQYADRGGILGMLSAGRANESVHEDFSMLMPSAITDATPADIGSIIVSGGAGAVIASAWQWYINFSFLYLKPGELS
jgi:hypothetical protein